MSVSGTPLSPWALSRNPVENAKRFINRINCYGPTSQAVLNCLQSKNAREIVSALEGHLSSGNISSIFGPVSDTFLNFNDQFIGDSVSRLARGEVDRRISFMIGENEADGSEIMYFLRKTLDRLNTRDIRYFIDNTLIPVSLLKYDTLVTSPFIQQLISFQYFSSQQSLDDKFSLLESIETFLTDSYYVAPIRETLEALARSGANVFSFVNNHPVRQQWNSYTNKPEAGAGSVLALLLGQRQFEVQTGSGMRGLDRQSSINVQDGLVPFIERSEPLTDLRWSRYTPQTKQYMVINNLRTNNEYKVGTLLTDVNLI